MKMFINLFAHKAPFLNPLKTWKNRKVFWCFQGVKKERIETNGLKEVDSDCQNRKNYHKQNKSLCRKQSRKIRWLINSLNWQQSSGDCSTKKMSFKLRITRVLGCISCWPITIWKKVSSREYFLGILRNISE